MSQPLSIRQLDGLEVVDAEAWNLLSHGEHPFVRHEYLHGLERHDCLRGHGWTPSHLTAWADDVLVGALPLYRRANSYGEFVFDWAWADAYERAGGRYYPKLVSAIPFAPVTGPRLLVRPGYPAAGTLRRRLAEAAVQLTGQDGLSSFHCLFPDEADLEPFDRLGLLRRVTCRYEWTNPGYRDFQDFLDALSSKKRKQIRRERQQVRDSGVEIEIFRGGEAGEAEWRAWYGFYCSTFHRRWGSPRLTLAFFESLGRTLPDQTLLILARRGREYVAGAFAMIGMLYGRHWGCSEFHAFLHFELCYYRTIDYCIAHGLQALDAGVQGEHKLARGFRPVGAVSSHYIHHPGLRRAVAGYLARETAEMEAYLGALTEHSPYRAAEARA